MKKRPLVVESGPVHIVRRFVYSERELEAVVARLDEIHAEVRATLIRMPELLILPLSEDYVKIG